MTPLEAAFHLYASVPKDKIRTHQWSGLPEISAGRRRTPGERIRLKADLQRARASGMTVRQMCKELHCTVRTIRRLLGPLQRFPTYRKK